MLLNSLYQLFSKKLTSRSSAFINIRSNKKLHYTCKMSIAVKLINRSISLITGEENGKFHRTATNLLNISAEEVKEWLKDIDFVLTDCDGVLWIDDKAIEGSVDCINKCKEAGKKVYFVTNNSTKTQEQLLKKSQDMGFEMVIDEIISTSRETAIYLKRREFTKKAYVVGSQGITKELDAAGIEHNEIGPDMLTGTMREMLDEFHPDPEVGVVIVGFDEHLSFPKMMKAASYLNNPECLFLATNTDERFPMTVHVVPGTGSIVKAIETAAERKPIVIGKPSSNICETLIKEKLIDPKRTLMIGDRCNTDILLGANCGFQTLLVGTGIHSMDDVKEWMRNGDDEQQKLIPDVFLPKLGDLLQFL